MRKSARRPGSQKRLSKALSKKDREFGENILKKNGIKSDTKYLRKKKRFRSKYRLQKENGEKQPVINITVVHINKHFHHTHTEKLKTDITNYE